MKSTKTLSAALCILSLCAGEIAVASEQLHGFEIRRAFRGITLDGIYRDGSFFTETYAEDGSLRYHDGNGADAGHWAIELDKFCTRYDSQKGGCFYVSSDGSNCFTFYHEIPGKSPRDTQTGAWDSRGWNRDHPSTCPKAPEVAI
jgi:hypothetical protein